MSESDSPRESADSQSVVSELGGGHRLTIIALLTVAGFITFASFFLIPHRRAHPAARRVLCLNNLKVIGLATLNYASQNDGALPLVNMVDEDRQPLHSWRAALLPQLDRAALYREIDKTKPWDSERNIEFSETVLQVYRCPDDPDFRDNSKPITNYFAVVGNQTAFPPVTPDANGQITHVTLDDITLGDGQSQTIGFAEATGLNVRWAEPKDISFDDLRFGISHENGRGFSSKHPGGRVNAIFLDGHVDSISHDIDPKVLQALATRNNAENEADLLDDF